MNMNFNAIKTSIEVVREYHWEEIILETFILVLMLNVTESHGKNFMS